MAEPPTTRAALRSHQIDTIKATSRRLLAQKGAAGLSLREVAREMGLVSSALYRYFATRDELLTALIVDAYNDLGGVAERAAARSRGADHRRQLHAVANAVRRWARSDPHQYALLFGSPVPGYVAPEHTIEPASRTTLVLSTIVTDAWRAASGGPEHDVSLGSMFETASLESAMPGVPDMVRARAIMVWTQIFGFISFELFGHYVGSVRNANRYYDFVIDECADLVLPGGRGRRPAWRRRS